MRESIRKSEKINKGVLELGIKKIVGQQAAT